MLAPEAPYPLAGGGALRTASLLEYLAQRYEVDLIVFREPDAPDPRASIPAGVVQRLHVVNLPPNSRGTLARAARNMGRLLRGVPALLDRFAGFEPQVAAAVASANYELAVVEHFWCAPYWDQIAAHSKQTILDLHNIESVLNERCARAERFPISLAYQAFARAYRTVERYWFPRFSLLLAASEHDAATAAGIAPASMIKVYPNAIPMTAQPVQTEQDVIVFSGNFAYQPNISAVRFFRRQIWPYLRERWPKLIWRLVGKNAQAVSRYTNADPRIEVRGAVPDAIEELAAAKVAVVPLLAGSGTRVKVLEAWAAGRPVVSTPMGAEGLPARHGENIMLADGPEPFAEAVSALLSDSQMRRRIGSAGRVTYEEQGTWESAWKKLDL